MKALWENNIHLSDIISEIPITKLVKQKAKKEKKRKFKTWEIVLLAAFAKGIVTITKKITLSVKSALVRGEA